MWLKFWFFHHPFHLRGYKVWWCYFCAGWGADPGGGSECRFCYGEGFKMSMWWDEDKKKYRYSIPYKIFYILGWPALRWVMFKLPSETAHHLAIRGTWLVGNIETCWSRFLAILVFSIILLPILLLCKLMPRWFRCSSPNLDQQE